MSDGATVQIAYGVTIPATRENISEVVEWLNSQLETPYSFPVVEDKNEEYETDWALIDFANELDQAFRTSEYEPAGKKFMRDSGLTFRCISFNPDEEDEINDSVNTVRIHVIYRNDANAHGNMETTTAPMFFDTEVPRHVVEKIKFLAAKFNAPFGHYAQLFVG